MSSYHTKIISLLTKNQYSDNFGYGSTNPNAISDGDEKGKGENNGKVGSSTDINLRQQNLSKNMYGSNNSYGLTHPNAISDNDEKGKGENSGQVGSVTDINTRNQVVATNKFNKNKGYPDF